jgi:tRNA pseudouridine13 synthase
LKSLELLWGISQRLYKFRPLVTSTILRPKEFVVIEPRPNMLYGSKNSFIYLVKRCCIDTKKVGFILLKELEGESYGYLGLKDADAVVYQYYVLHNVKKPTNHLLLRVDKERNVEAWLIAKHKGFASKSRRGNIFIVSLKTSDATALCNYFKKLDYIPGYYGPQRFGILRPNTHIQGLYLLKKEIGYLVNEFTFRYPLEEREDLGFYERPVVENVKKSHTIALASSKLNNWIKELLIEALQSYIFNRALSKVIELDGIDKYSEKLIPIRCINKKFWVPASRLPASGVNKTGTSWARLLKKIIDEEGVHELISKGIGLRPILRPLIFPICKINCEILSKEKVTLKFSLPPGAYATIALWQISEITWTHSSSSF